MKKRKFTCKIEAVNIHTQEKTDVCKIYAHGDGINILKNLNEKLSEKSDIFYRLITL